MHPPRAVIPTPSELRQNQGALFRRKAGAPLEVLRAEVVIAAFALNRLQNHAGDMVFVLEECLLHLCKRLLFNLNMLNGPVISGSACGIQDAGPVESLGSILLSHRCW